MRLSQIDNGSRAVQGPSMHAVRLDTHAQGAVKQTHAAHSMRSTLGERRGNEPQTHVQWQWQEKNNCCT